LKMPQSAAYRDEEIDSEKANSARLKMRNRLMTMVLAEGVQTRVSADKD
jgi:hypothetical protein